MKISERTLKKQTVSARVNEFVYEIYKENELPLSAVIEAGLIHFLKLNNNDKIKYLSSNLPELVEDTQLKYSKNKWPDMLMDSMQKMNIPKSVAQGLIKGSLLGCVAIIASVLLSKAINEDK